jgi:hypothetical protein
MDERSPTPAAVPERRLRRAASALTLALVLAAAAYVGWRTAGRERTVPRESARTSPPVAAAPRVRAPASPAWVDQHDSEASPRLWRTPRLRAAPGPEQDTAAQAALVLALYRKWDADRFAAIFHDGADAFVLEDDLAWFRERLGECDAPEVLNVSDDDDVRWVYGCTGGELETQIELDGDRRIRTLFIGAHGIEPPADVRAAAEVVLGMQRGWNDDVFASAFAETFDIVETRTYIEEFTATWGVCTLAGVDLAGERGGLLDVSCEQGPRLLKVQLGGDGKIVETWFGKPREF